MASHDRYGWRVDAVQCAECSLVYLGRTFTYEGATRFYAQRYRPLVNAWHDRPRGDTWRAETEAYRARCLPYWPTVSRDQWLDVGGEDWNPERTADVLEVMPVTRTYALVTCCQTLDHLIDPVTAFHKFAQLVRVGGHLWVDIVDYDVTRELKADHPLNWTNLTLQRAIGESYWRRVKTVSVDDRHLGIVLERW